MNSIDLEGAIEPELVIPGMIGITNTGTRAVVKVIFKKSNIDSNTYESLKKSDTYSENLPERFDDFLNSFNRHDYIVVVSELESNDDGVFLYKNFKNTNTGRDEVFKVPESERWRLSKTLNTMNQRTGIFEHLKSFKQFQ